MTVNHEICIDNFKPDESVSYSVIIIKGHIQNKPILNCQTLNTSHIFLNSNQQSFETDGEKFKVITQLNYGVNLITLRYCCSVINFNINYISRESDLTVLPLYIICTGHNGNFQAPDNEKCDPKNACQRISLCSKLLQSVIAEKLYEGSFCRKTFKLEDDCKIFYSKLNYLEARKLSQEQLWSALGREIVNSDFGKSNKRKFLGFISCTRYLGEKYNEKTTASHEDILQLTEAHVALGGGGLALFGTACLFTWPEDLCQITQRFQDTTVVDKRKFMDDSCYRGTYGACFSTTLGAVLHELCHTFDLGHTEKGIMGRGFDNISKVFVYDKRTEISASQPAANIDRKQIIKFKEKLDLGFVSERTIDMKENNFHIIKSAAVASESDDIFWTKSCLVFLTYHKWLNNFETYENKIKFDSVAKLVSSTSGLRVIELRNEEDGLVIESWVFVGRVLKFYFQIPEECFFVQESSRKTVVVIVQDNVGNILKETVKI